MFAAATAAVWILVGILGLLEEINGPGAAAAAGVAVIIGAAAPPLPREALAVGGPALIVTTLVAALPPSGRATWPLVLVAIALAVHLAITATERVASGVAVAGSAALAVGTAVGLDPLTLAGAALLAVAGATAARQRHVAAALVPLALVAGLFASEPEVPEATVLGAFAVLAAAANPAVALALLSLAVAVISPDGALLIAAAAVLTAGIANPASAAIALPGAVAVAITTAATPATMSAIVAAASVAGTAVVLMFPSLRAGVRARIGSRALAALWTREDDGGRRPVRVGAIPAIAAGTWLLVAPATWEWTGIEGLGPYTEGALIATAAAGIAVVVASMLGLVVVRVDRLDW